MDKVASIDELQRHWECMDRHFPNERGGNAVHLGGGRLRGLLLWIDQEFTAGRSVAEVRAKRPPSLENLAQFGGTDKDLFPANDQVANMLQRAGLTQGWDVLDPAFRRASLDAGGSGIEKLMVSPYSIVDPLHSLHAFHSDKINYHDTLETTFSRYRQAPGAHNGGLGSNSKLALILRHIRFHRMLLGDLPDYENRRLARIAQEEAHNFTSSDNYWVQKALNKLHEGNGRNFFLTRNLLKRLGVLQRLYELGYTVQDPDGSLRYLNDQLVPRGQIRDHVAVQNLKIHAVVPIEGGVKWVAEAQGPAGICVNLVIQVQIGQPRIVPR